MCTYSVCKCACVCFCLCQSETQLESEEINHFPKSNSYLCNSQIQKYTHARTESHAYPCFHLTNQHILIDYHTHLNLLLNSSMSQAKVQASRTQIRFRLHSDNVAVLKNTNVQQKKLKSNSWLSRLHQICG